MDLNPYEKILSDSAGRGFYSKVLATIADAFEESARIWETHFDHPYAEAKTFIPEACRCLISRNLRQIVKDDEATVEWNAAKNSPYTILRLNGLLLTHSRVRSPNELPRNSIFREWLSETYWPDFFGDPQGTPSGLSYGIILSGPSGFDEAIPGFVAIGFPNRPYSEYEKVVNLVEYCQKIEDYKIFAIEEEPQTKKPIIVRADRRRAENE